ncbi:MAG: ligase-associated DNA damage response DEXH box helicase, partial [Bacteroidota bacterium]
MNHLIQTGLDWYRSRGWSAFPFQQEMMQQVLSGKSGLLNAPTGSGKTLAMWIPAVLHWMREQDDVKTKHNGLQILWITPLRALSKDIRNATQEACDELGLKWSVETRTGDTSSAKKKKQLTRMPEGLITTPESMHVLFSREKHTELFKDLRIVVVDEWHELIGSKRGVQMELALQRLRKLRPDLLIWGISATIGNMEQSLEVLLGSAFQANNHAIVRSKLEKKIEVVSLLPDNIERFPWSGHLGIHMMHQVMPILEASRTTLVFTNTRAQCEIWYQALLEANPDLAGQIAMHHASIDNKLRDWVEEALHAGQLKVVVCTSSLDLGVDFRPVETIVQIGGPKGVARFLQRAGRSGHQPGALSRIYFVPTHSLELVEASALRQAAEAGMIESRLPVIMAHDVLVQYLITLGVADGFRPDEVYEEVVQTYAYQELSRVEFDWMLDFITTGGKSLYAYDAYKKVEIDEEGHYQVHDKRIILQHKMSIGTIVSDVVMTVKYLKGGRLGTVEESFISQLKPGDIFWFAGRPLELVKVRNLEVLVRRAKSQKGKVPRWMGARMQLSSQMSEMLRQQLDDFKYRRLHAPEIECLVPLFEVQERWSAIPKGEECLIESIHSREGHHLFIYPFEGRVVHEILGTILAYRLSQRQAQSFSIAMNDYGLELLSDQEIPIEDALSDGLFSPEDLSEDITRSINETEMAQRRFREVAT